jgi:putative membrane protein
MEQMIEQCTGMMGMMGGMGGMGSMMGGGMMWPMLGSTLLLISLGVAGGVLLWRALQNRTTARQQPLEILQERFARGELDPEDYQQRLSMLHGNH